MSSTYFITYTGTSPLVNICTWFSYVPLLAADSYQILIVHTNMDCFKHQRAPLFQCILSSSAMASG